MRKLIAFLFAFTTLTLCAVCPGIDGTKRSCFIAPKVFSRMSPKLPHYPRSDAAYASKRRESPYWKPEKKTRMAPLNAGSQSNLPKTSGSVDVPCLLSNCRFELGLCVVSRVCQDGLGCAKNCENGVVNVMDCQARCSFLHDDDGRFSKLGVCLVKNKCTEEIITDEPEIPSTFIPGMSLERFEGKWHVLAGLNRGADCWNSQTKEIQRVASDKYLVDQHIILPLGDGRTKMKKIRNTVVGSSIGAPLDASYDLNGIKGHDRWFIIYTDPSANYLIYYYVGKSEISASYRGLNILSRKQGYMPESVKLDIENALYLSKIGISLDDLCMLQT